MNEGYAEAILARPECERLTAVSLSLTDESQLSIVPSHESTSLCWHMFINSQCPGEPLPLYLTNTQAGSRPMEISLVCLSHDKSAVRVI
jgi:hypothetical protein